MPRYRVPALERAFKIMDMLEHSSLGLTKSDIARRLSLPYSSVFNLLTTLEEHHYAWRDDSGRYYPGTRLLNVERFESDYTVLRRTAVPVMKGLIGGTVFTCHLAVLQGGEAVYIERQEPGGFFKLNTWVGQRVYVHTSAVGKALIAYQPKAKVQELWDRGLPRRTVNSITSFRRLWTELRKIRERGYAFDDQEDQIGGRCVAAPISLPSGKVVSALGISAMAEHLATEEMPKVAEELVQATSSIARLLSPAA